MIKVKRNGNKETEQELNEKMQSLLLELAEKPDDEKEKQVVKIYEKLTGYTSGCGICRNGREMFKKGVKQIMNGEAQNGLNSIKASKAALKVNIHRLAKKFGF